MYLEGPEGRRVALCYSMNVHPGEGLDDVLAALRDFVLPVRDEVFGAAGPFAVGLRLANRAAREAEARLPELASFLRNHGLDAVTVNAFPYGDFHAARVKEAVYAPDWADPARAEYTLGAAKILAALAEPGRTVSLSTVPLSFAAWKKPLTALAGGVASLLPALSALEEETGVRAVVALEPEPFCVLETARDFEAFWRKGLFPEALARRYLAICLDTCHSAVRWEDGIAAVESLRGAGVPIAKMQLSAALEAEDAGELAPFRETRYLHQVYAEDGSGAVDLEGNLPQGRVRCHFHVPVHREAVAGVKTTREHMALAFAHALERDATRCFEIETYTWDVLPDRVGDLVESLCEEYRFVLGVAAACGYRPEG